jgi:hypothetical protein
MKCRSANSLLLCTAVLATGCVPHWLARGSDCAPDKPVEARRFSPSDVKDLVGAYRLITRTTVKGYDDYTSEGVMRFAVNDTLARYYILTIRGYLRRGDRELGGRYIQVGGTRPETVVVSGRSMSVGCQAWMCTDASPDDYQVEWLSSAAFGGRWENLQTGILHAVGKDGHTLPNPSGYFCARRIAQ